MVKLSDKEANTLLAFLNRVQVKGVQEAKVLTHLADRLMESEVETDAFKYEQNEEAGDTDVQSK